MSELSIPIYTLETEPTADPVKVLLYGIVDGESPNKLQSLRFKLPGIDTPIDLGSEVI